jgi:MarR family 2-MHQ and catechol resistance regulon transcriptional repressor
MSRAAVAPRSAPSADLQRDAVALQAAVAELVRVYQFRDRDRICCHDISVTQCYALETLVDHGPMRLGSLADRLFLDKSTTSRVVATLVKKGYVEQRADEADGRATALQATASGRRLCKRITDGLIEQQKQLLQDLDPDVREGVVKVIRGLAQAADSRFRSGVSVGAVGVCCAPGADGDGSCR